MKLRSSKRKLFCETSFRNDASKLKNVAFLRDCLKKCCFEAWHVDRTLDLRITIRTSNFLMDASKVITAPATKKLSRGIRSPVTDPCWITFPWHEIWNRSTDSASEASNIDMTKPEIPAPATQKAPFRNLLKSTTLANVFATPTNSCTCHGFCNVLKSLHLPREMQFERQKTFRDRKFFNIFWRFWLPDWSRATALCKLCGSQFPKMLRTCSEAPVFRQNHSRATAWCKFYGAQLPKARRTCQFFYDFNFQIALVPQRGANFTEPNFQKCSKPANFFTILTSKSLSRHSAVQILQSSISKSAPTPSVLMISTSESLSRHSVVQILSASWAAGPPQLPFLEADFASLRSHKAMEKHSILPNSYPPNSLISPICAVKHLCCKTSMLSNIDAARPGGNFQYSRKLDS